MPDLVGFGGFGASTYSKLVIDWVLVGLKTAHVVAGLDCLDGLLVESSCVAGEGPAVGLFYSSWSLTSFAAADAALVEADCPEGVYLDSLGAETILQCDDVLGMI